MTTPIIAIRPEPGLTETLELGQKMGLDMQGFALSRALACDWEVPDPGQFDAILAGSANAFRGGADALSKLRGLPVFAVGQKTADAAEEAGFVVARKGTGGLQALIDDLGPEKRHLLRLSGKDRVALELPAETTMQAMITYRMESLEMTEECAQALRTPSLVLLYSASSAAHFRACCARRDLDLSAISIAALGPRIGAAAGEGWRAVHSSEKPVDADLLALAKSLCQL